MPVATTTAVKASSITSTELSDKLQKQSQQEQEQQQQQQQQQQWKLLTAFIRNKFVQIQEHQQHQQQHQQHHQKQHKHYYNLIACAIAATTTAKTTTKTKTAPTTTITRTARKDYSKLRCRSGNSGISWSILTFLLSFMLHNHVFQTGGAAVTAIVPSPTLKNFEILHQPQYNNKNNNSAMLQYHQHLHNNRDLFTPLQLPLQPKANSNTNNNTFESFSIIDRLTAETEMNQMPIFDFGMPRNITGRSGQTEAIIKCRVDVLNDKSVSWIRKRDLHILTVGTATYTSDKRFEVSKSKDAREWTLRVKMPQPRDSGIYECQVNTEPKMSMAFQLNINVISPDAKAIISGPPDSYFKVGSAIILNCIVEQPSVKDIGPIYWYRGEHMITPFNADNDDNAIGDTVALRGGVGDIGGVDGTGGDDSRAAFVSDIAPDDRAQELSNDILTHDFATRIAMESQLGDTLKSRLRISHAQRTDSGNYTCQPTTASSGSVMVHVINDENPAAMQKSNANALYTYKLPAAGATFVATVMVTNVCCLVYHHLIAPFAVAALVVDVIVAVAVTVCGSATAANLPVSTTDSQVCLS